MATLETAHWPREPGGAGAPLALSAEILETRLLLAANHLVFLPPSPSGTETAGTSFLVTVQVQDNTNTPVTSNHSVVTLTESGPGPFSTGHTSVMQSASGGVADFNVILTKTGTYTFTATDGKLGKAVETGIVVVPDTTDAEHLAFVGLPSSGTAGNYLKQFQVDVFDKYGNLDTTSDRDGDNVVLTETGPGPFDTLNPNSQISAHISNGVAVFDNVILDTAGNYKLSANDANNPTSPTVAPTTASCVLTIHAGQAAALSFENGTVTVGQPLTGTAGKAFTAAQDLKVDVTDAYGNLVTSDHSVVTLVVIQKPSPGYTDYQSPIHLTATAVNGVATFKPTFYTGTNVFTNPGFVQQYYLLGATDSADGIASSANNALVQINAAAATTLQFIVQPTDSVSTDDAMPFSVAVEDAYGNVVTSGPGSNALVTVAIQSGDGNQTPTSNGAAGAHMGIATFTGFQINNFGVPSYFTLVATSPGLSDAYSDQFKVA